ncbi:MFS transporter [Pseudoclavibacter sp. RFBJ3]|uniref:MFS transporter n=1 Tax=unclassified Pseudoclavibacter TaxID=2615177 RepID=UPI000CE798D3|nr:MULTISPECIES: MFS transporter [unclassified Pseudoclavibacter]PPF80631.1 MFS transporter [Pseudoclavibacter sp. RFBJ5]PPF88714.1 MFS transporter [Pseudoclavibacter sp. RFBJ3]PPF93438.1 MFS transporter [Pseudoclavibacter sp. RFBH5]PPG17686.1 MFS transporter [Pseudoclavibacter sp. RFBI4]
MTRTQSDTGAVSQENEGKTPRKAALSGWIGSVLEYYDFTLYSQAAALVFPVVFFPTGDPTVALISSLATYAVGYVARPIGAIVLGNWGDKHGRKNVLVIAMLLMGLSTLAVGFLPTYDQIGLWAPLILVFLRLIQGFAVAGELGGASAMIVEHAPAGRRGFFASFGLQGTQAGSIIATAVFIPLTAVLTDEAFIEWGWRIPFMLSAVVVLAGFLIRKHVEEPPAYTRSLAVQQAQNRQAPVIELFKNNGWTVFRAILMTLANVAGVTTLVFGTSFATQEAYGVAMPASTFLWVPLIANVAAVIVIPVFGMLSDKIGRRTLMIVGSFGSGLVAIGYLSAIQSGNLVLTIVLAILMMGVLFQMWNATFATFFQELFPTQTRVTGFAISQNVGLMIVAFLPSIFTFVAPPGSDNVPLVVGGLTLAIATVSALATLFTPETRGKDIENHD